MRRRRRGLVAAGCVVFAAGLIAAPFILPGYWVRVLTSIFMFGTLAQSYNLIVGFAGYPSFGNVVFFGLGAYAVAILGKAGAPLAVGLIAAAVLSALVAVVLGLPVLRLRKQYFAVATIGIMQAVRELVVNQPDLTGGSKGLLVAGPSGDPRSVYGFFYFGMLALLAAVTLALFAISREWFGFGLRAIRDDETAAAVMGIPTRPFKVAAWAISAVMAALAGGLYAPWLGFLEPANVFDINLVVQAFIMMLLGGMGTVLGPVLGAALLTVTSELVWAQFGQLNLVILGVLILAVVFFLPNGLMHRVGVWREQLASRGAPPAPGRQRGVAGRDATVADEQTTPA